MYHILVSAVAYDGGKSGISDYINQVIQHLSKKNKLTVLMLKKDIENFPIKNENIRFVSVSNFLQPPLRNMLWHLYLFPIYHSFKKYDFIFLTAGNRRLFFRYKKPVIVTFHDLSQFHIAQKYDIFRMFYIKKVIPFYLKRCNSICAISENTKKDLLKYFSIEDSKIFVNYNGVDSEKFMKYKETPVDYPYSHLKKYLLYIARIEHPGKNHLKLIQAYEQLPDSIKSDYELVFVGKAWSGSDVVYSYVSKSEDKKRIHFLGFVADRFMPILYQNAFLYVFPSLYEGFGIPLIEAFAKGVPAICSNTSSLPEIGGDAVELFDPYDVTSICNSLQKVISNREMRTEMIQKGKQRLSLFDWEKHTDSIVNTFENIKNEQR